MRRITTWLLATLAGLVLLFSYHTSTDPNASATASADLAPAPSSGTTTTTSGTGNGTATRTRATSATSSSSASSSAATTSTSASGTYTGAAARTPYGPVQVQVTVSDGQVASVQALTYPYSSGRDRAVNSRAIPVLDQEATASQGTSVHMVSGASFTSAAYEQSLQSALDRAHL